MNHAKQTPPNNSAKSLEVSSDMDKSRDRICLKCYVTQKECDVIEAKMAELGTSNRSAFLRKMALDGYVVNLDIPELREMLKLLRYSSNNLNQLTRRAHETGRIYDDDLECLRREYGKLLDAAEIIISKLTAIQ